MSSLNRSNEGYVKKKKQEVCDALSVCVLNIVPEVSSLCYKPHESKDRFFRHSCDLMLLI